MAIIYMESGFNQYARPIKHVKKGKKSYFNDSNCLSSAYGYAQVLDGTWSFYRKKTGLHKARRDNFSDCARFIGWYNAHSYKVCGIKKNDVYSLYLAYHEGHCGFNRYRYRNNKDLIQYARQVEKLAHIYHNQLKSCKCHKPLKYARSGGVAKTRAVTPSSVSKNDKKRKKGKVKRIRKG